MGKMLTRAAAVRINFCSSQLPADPAGGIRGNMPSGFIRNNRYRIAATPVSLPEFVARPKSERLRVRSGVVNAGRRIHGVEGGDLFLRGHANDVGGVHHRAASEKLNRASFLSTVVYQALCRRCSHLS